MAEPPAPTDVAPKNAAPADPIDGAPPKPKFRRPPVIGDRSRPPGTNPELEMLGQLGMQARDILRLAERVEDSEFQNFQDYLTFRDKISEFEAFCNVIESHLKDTVTERRKELEDRFYSLWSMIFRPTLRALMRFFSRIEGEPVLPLGGKDMLEAELRALRSMRSILNAPRFSGKDDKMLNDVAKLEVVITKLELIIAKLAERATSLPDFSGRPTVTRSGVMVAGRASAEDATEDEPAPVVPAPPPPRPAAPVHMPATGAPTASATPTIGEAPNLRAVRELKGLLDYYRRDKTLRQYVDIDTRAVDEIERKLVANPMDPAAIVWMRQICNAWASRLRMDEKEKDIRRVLGMIRSS